MERCAAGPRCDATIPLGGGKNFDMPGLKFLERKFNVGFNM